jgi:hypothetical protein
MLVAKGSLHTVYRILKIPFLRFAIPDVEVSTDKVENKPDHRTMIAPELMSIQLKRIDQDCGPSALRLFQSSLVYELDAGDQRTI